MLNDNKTLNSKSVVQFILKYGIYFLFVLICVVLALTNGKFLTVNNLINVLLQTCIIAAIAIGMTFVIITQGIDVSVGAVMAVASATGVGLIKVMDAPWYIGMLAMIIVGVIFGVINGVAVSYLRMPAFLVTLATQSAARGLTLVFSGGKSWYDLPKQFSALGSSSLFGIPVLVLIVVLLYIAGYITLNRTIYGRQVFAVGGNPNAAKVSGINVNYVLMTVYIINGLITGAAAILQTARLNSFWASMGTGMEFSVIAGVVVGGTSLAGGVGTLSGTFIGVLLLGIIDNALNLWGVPANWQDVARGLIIFLAVMLDAFRTRYSKAE